VATSISRVGAAIGTFLLPMSLSHLGIGMTMLIGAGITLVGCLVSVAWAEETRGRTLAETSAVPTAATRASSSGEERPKGLQDGELERS
jgi:MFS transporter, putative metabolite transport protein